MLRIINNNIDTHYKYSRMGKQEPASELHGGLFKRFSLLFSIQSNWFWLPLHCCISFNSLRSLWMLLRFLFTLFFFFMPSYRWLNRIEPNTSTSSGSFRQSIDLAHMQTNFNRISSQMRSIESAEYSIFDFIHSNLNSDWDTKSIRTLCTHKNYGKCLDHTQLTANFMQWFVVWDMCASVDLRMERSFLRIFLCLACARTQVAMSLGFSCLIFT